MNSNLVKQILIIAGISLVVSLWVAPMVQKMMNKSSSGGGGGEKFEFEDEDFEFEDEDI